uniref:BLTX238 n=1 Tax=Nephila pilipes TaxID=299642 RepID=A0A076KZ63_NEPPI|nr:BLTX238 [Nephila pilipes]
MFQKLVAKAHIKFEKVIRWENVSLSLCVQKFKSCCKNSSSSCIYCWKSSLSSQGCGSL